MTPLPRKLLARVVAAAARSFFGVHSKNVPSKLRSLVEAFLVKSFQESSDAEQKALLKLAQRLVKHPGSTESLVGLRKWLGPAALAKWVQAHPPPVKPPGDAPSLRLLVNDWLLRAGESDGESLVLAAIHFAVQPNGDSDRQLLDDSYQRFLSDKEKEMVDFAPDQRGLPKGFDLNAFNTEVNGILKDSLGLEASNDSNKNFIAAIKGSLLLKGFFSADAFGLRGAIEDAWKLGLGTTKDISGNDVANRQVYDKVVNFISGLTERRGQPVFFQELASVSAYAIENAESVPVDHPNFGSQMRIGLDKYVAGQAPSDSLVLPPLTTGAGVEIEPPNVEAVGNVYLAVNAERMQLFHVVDRITELFMNGLLPVSYEPAGRALEGYYFDAENRLNEAARNSVYGRVVGAPNTDVSKEVKPNREFDTLLLRFISSLAEYDRQQRTADLLQRQRSLSLTGEQVRNNGRAWGSNASLYGWAGTQVAARRIKAHILTAFNLLSLRQIQNAFGVSTEYQVIERVSLNEFGQAPNIVKYKTMGEAGAKLLVLVAKHADAWNSNSGKPLFNEPQNGNVRIGDIPPEDQGELMVHAQNWLAVNGIADEQVIKMSQPADTVFAPAVPAFGAVSAKSTNGAVSGDVMDRLQQMVASGSAPTLDQLRQMLPAFKA